LPKEDINEKSRIDRRNGKGYVQQERSRSGISSSTGGNSEGIEKGNSVILVGFGTFSLSKRKAQKGRNPQAGEVIKIAAKKVPVFKAGKGLRNMP
jgi:DNA-binding protein HU-beta